MSKQFFKCVVRMDKVQEDGIIRKVSETYLVDAMSHTEAEARIVEELAQYSSGEFEVYSITRAALAEVLTSDDEAADKYYQTIIGFITLDEKTSKEKMIRQRILIQAKDFDAACVRLREEMRKIYGDVVALEVKQVPYLDYFTHKEV